MCLALPGKVVSISDMSGLKMAKVSFNGIVKDICIEWLPEAVVGDYVMAHAGSALSIVNAKEAHETLKIFDQWANGLEEQDNQ